MQISNIEKDIVPKEIQTELQEYFEFNSNLINMEIYAKKLPALGILNSLIKMMMNSSQFPDYIKAATTKYLYQTLQRPDGCASLFHSLIKQDPDDHITFLHFEKISNIIQSPRYVDLPTYYNIVCKQLLAILNSSTENKTNGALDSVTISIKCAAFVIVNFVNKRPKMAKALLISPILQPLLNYIKPVYDSTLDTELDLDGNRIVAPSKDLQQCLKNLEHLLVGNEPSYALIECFLPSMSHLTLVVHPLYAIYQYSNNSLQTKVFQLLSIIIKLLDTPKAVAVLVEITKNSVEKVSLGISNSSEGGIHTFDPVILAKFMSQLEKPELVGDFFVQVLETRLVLVNNDIRDTEELAIYYSGVIVAFLDTFEDTLLKNTKQILKFVKATLLDSDDDEKHMGLTLLSQIFNNKDEPVEDLESLNEIKIILSTLCDGNDQVALLARSVQLQLMSRAKSNTRESKSEEIFREALKELGDELLPIRAHGMNQIRYLVLQKDPISIQHLDSIINIFIDFLQDTDSFIYLNAIKGCSALADVYPEKTLNKLATIYKDIQYTDEVRSRMGESILQIIQRSGELYPKYDLDIKKSILVLATNLIRNLKNVLVQHVGLDQLYKLKTLLEILVLNEKDLVAKGHAEMCLDDLNNLI
ncbi:transmembrane and coiled-coil domains-containing protein 7 [Boothiomyces sp. JEL0838]|nr:transmembrane and coiled-coil domains-containing protein 7 [Boothiomyces sp. JEL0838]